jgi:hypothetical protein
MAFKIFSISLVMMGGYRKAKPETHCQSKVSEAPKNPKSEVVCLFTGQKTKMTQPQLPAQL